MEEARSSISLDEAVELTRSGDIWLFRGGTGADRAIQLATNAPVNHVALAVVIDDLPPMMWHAELGRGLIDLWTGTHHRGAQLHDLRASALRWMGARHQRAWLRQLQPETGRVEDDALMRSIARWNGTSFPSTAQLAWRWLSGRSELPVPGRGERSRAEQAEAAYCAELAGVTLEAMGVVEAGDKPINWYDPGTFWSGDRLPVTQGWAYGGEIEVVVDR